MLTNLLETIAASTQLAVLSSYGSKIRDIAGRIEWSGIPLDEMEEELSTIEHCVKQIRAQIVFIHQSGYSGPAEILGGRS